MSTDNLKEIWDIYDQSLNKITEKKRFEPLNKGEYHLVVNAFIYNSKNQVLLQKRAMEKLNYPGYWEESVGGSALKGENHLDAIQREIKEELNLDLLVYEKNFYMRCIEQNWIEDWFVFRTDFQINDLQLQTEEVELVNLFSFDQAIKQLRNFGIRPYKEQLDQANKIIHMTA
ncbi:NUDIX hydrolase [Liquorilactobacillus sicerae]|uniref:NUDIX hydrolase n=1 Tax=Liquorilactobacillus sicerae TaxID=1416943 RepID=UPI00247FE770|nr:NUDIX domain-containing protein [Liquorilactobacillus sicerae]